MTVDSATQAGPAAEPAPMGVVATAPGPGSAGRGRSGLAGAFLNKFLLPFSVFALIIGIWYLVSGLTLSPRQRFMLPLPHDVVRVGILDWDNFSKTLEALKYTVIVTFTGLAISMVLGVLAAVLMNQAKWVESSLYPWAVVLQTIPILALTPVLSFFFGFALTSRTIVCVIISFFPIVSNTLFGLQSVDRGMHELFTLHHTGRFTRLWKLQLPAAMPAMFSGFRIAAGQSVIGAVVGEFFFKQGNAGLGTNLSVFASRLEGERLWATTLVASLLGVAVFVFFGWLSRVAVGRWYQPRRG
ncbi:ABC transporter permease [Frankia sp. CNm7]|uniref:ABC transporter permease n=1 Tax=Frankia nepalensis TaxID=1836974 RepID=A0A937RGR8_9ACTN|nr:ABC transporter permease [Frankia nepalensis]MBL7500101.1 ABC transporter permease [Frankia nepalensis]MBL7512442.1 ABC transporter permease [Frankia nepalensis]MBL7519500.1 ABC transporter permease [Frankia nepalensis]MBL7628579.1 ABC transporter permease [Frankia nepalensis]